MLLLLVNINGIFALGIIEPSLILDTYTFVSCVVTASLFILKCLPHMKLCRKGSAIIAE